LGNLRAGFVSIVSQEFFNVFNWNAQSLDLFDEGAALFIGYGW